MGFLDSDTVVVDAILTKYGRKKLAQGLDLNINMFALSDEGVDYNLWNDTHPSGSDYYDDDITAMPLMEVVPDNGVLMRYKLFDLDRDTDTFGTIDLAPITGNESKISTDVTLAVDHLSVLPSTTPSYVTPGTAGGGEYYIFRVNDRTGFQFEATNPMPGGGEPSINETSGVADTYVPSVYEVRQPAVYIAESLTVYPLSPPNDITCHITIEGYSSGAITTHKVTNLKPST